MGNYLARARMSPLPDPVEAVEGSRVRACTENLADRFSRNFLDCLLSWSSCACSNMEKICDPLHGF